MNNKKIIIISSIIIAVLVLTIGVTYSIFSLSRTSKNSNLIVGDIYMHYNETTNAINITDMMPTSTIKVNTDAESVSKCVEYLKTTYGDEWNGLSVSGTIAPSSNSYKDAIVRQILEEEKKAVGTYSEYCSCKRMTYKVESELKNDKNEEVIVKPMEASTTITKTIYMLNDLENGTLTEADKKYFEDNGIIEDNTLGLPYFEFTIDGKNTHTTNGVSYNIQLVHGDVETNKTRIQDKFLKFRLVEVNNSKETILKDKLTIDNISNTTIYSSTIPANTTSEITRTYRLYMWIDGNVNICGGTQTEGCDYNVSDWSNLFASVKVNVNGKYVEGTNFVEAVKNRYNGSNQDGLVAVNTSGDLATSGTIREYRYSGIGNYCTYTDGTNDYNLSVVGSTCPKTACLLDTGDVRGVFTEDNDIFDLLGGSCTDFEGTTLNIKNNQTEPTDSGIRNYVTFNNETWRIVGIFNEENSNGIKDERIKLVKDEPISISTEVPAEIEKEGITYEIFNTKVTSTKYKYFYWNYPDPDSNYSANYNDWTKAGSMYYLNENYLNSLENSTIIENMKYYLGGLVNKSTLKEIYENERNETNILSGNQATWNGKIALLYPSDLGYARETKGWSDAIINNINYNNWMLNDQAGFWLLSPRAVISDTAADWCYFGLAWGFADIDFALRPVLSLRSQTMISSGTGSINDPYIIVAE